MYKQHHSNIVTKEPQFPSGTKLKVTVDAKPGTTTAKYFGQTGVYQGPGASPTMCVVWFGFGGLATVMLDCVSPVEMSMEVIKNPSI